jgi:DHA3 family macrolide efflux protein-like MFS transporter
MFFTDLTSIWLIFIIHTLRSALQAFQVPTVQAIIPSMVPKEKLSRINGLNFLFSGVIYMIGPIVSALLLELFPITQIFLIDIITFIMALVPLLMIKIPFQAKMVEKSERKSFKTDLFDGFKLVKSIPGLLALICFAMIFNFIFRPYNLLIPFVISSVHDGTAFNLAFLFGSWQVGNIIGSLICSIKKTWKNKIKVNVIGESLFFVTNLIVILAPYRQFYLMMIGAFLGAIVFPMTVATYLTIFQERVPSDKIGRVMSLDHTISMAIAPIGALIAGPLASLMGITPLLVTCAIIGIVNPFFIWRFTKIRELENPQEIDYVSEEDQIIKQELIEIEQNT